MPFPPVYRIEMVECEAFIETLRGVVDHLIKEGKIDPTRTVTGKVYLSIEECEVVHKFMVKQSRAYAH